MPRNAQPGHDALAATIGRPVATSHARIERAAFRLFAERGFQQTTLDDIAREVGVGRRTLFRYFDSKNDIPWGQFGASLAAFRRDLEATPGDIGVAEAVHRSVVAFNDFDKSSLSQHRERMELILTTPALQAHSALRYADWRAVIADYVAWRSGLGAKDFLPRMAGHVSLSLSLSAYEVWLEQPGSDLVELLQQGLPVLRRYLA